ncbi:AzlD domain-containing protein [Jatrophihabitans sp. YIM 134969]
MTAAWIAVLAASAAAYALKLLGHLVPARWLDHPVAVRVTTLLPVALLAALVVVQTVATGDHLTVDARVVGIGAAVVALVLRAPFIVVVVVAAVAAALTRVAGWG